MKNITKRISLAKHIVVISCDEPSADSLASASAMYTYLLQQHKKVSFFCKSKTLHQRYSFLPWMEKVRPSFPSSADLAISFGCENLNSIMDRIECEIINFDKLKSVDSTTFSTTQVVYDFFKDKDIKINMKMATSLYAGILEKSDGFLSDKMNERVFSIAQDLVKSGADIDKCNHFIMKYQTLAGLKLKAIMLSSMQLLCNAQAALFVVKTQNLLSTAGSEKDCFIVLDEALSLPTVNLSVLLQENTDMTFTCSLRSNDPKHLEKIASLLGASKDTYRFNITLKTNESIENIQNKIIQTIQKEI